MRTLLASILTVLTLALATLAAAQQPPAGHQHEPGKPSTQSAPPGTPHGGGMMGGMHQGGGMMGGMHQGGMMGGGMCGMMGGMGSMMGGMGGGSDPQTLARTLQLRGEIMKAVGDVLIKHAQTLAATPAK